MSKKQILWTHKGPCPYCRKGVFCIPDNRYYEDILRQLPDGALLQASDKTSPSDKLRAFYWVVLGKIVENHQYYYDAEQLNEVVKYGINYVDPIVDHEMNVRTVPRSNAKVERTLKEYKLFCDKAFDFLFTHILPDCRKEVIKEVEKMLGYTLKSAQEGNRGKHGVESDDPLHPGNQGFDGPTGAE